MTELTILLEFPNQSPSIFGLILPDFMMLSLRVFYTLHNGLMGSSLQVLATSARNTENNNIAASDNSDGDSRLNLGDEENMVSGSNSMHIYKFQASIGVANREKYLRYRTRLFAAEYVFLSCVI